MSQHLSLRPVVSPTAATTAMTKLTSVKRRIENDAEATLAPEATGNEPAGDQAAEHGLTPADELQAGGSPAGDAAANGASASTSPSSVGHVATSAEVVGETATFSPVIVGAVGLGGFVALAAGGGGGSGRDGRVTSTPPVVQPPVVEPPVVESPVVHPPVVEPPVTQPPVPQPQEPQKPADPQQPDPAKMPDGGPQGPNPPGGQTPDPTKAPVEMPVETPPDAPQLKLLHDTGVSAEDKLTSDGTVQVDGIANGNGWKYSLDGGATWVGGSDDHRISGSRFSADGEQHVLVSQVTPSGLAGAATELVFQLDTTAPGGGTGD